MQYIHHAKRLGYLFTYQKSISFHYNEICEKVYDTLQRLHSSDEFPGSRISSGMATKIINRHGGKIWVETAENDGATFFFVFPKKLHNTILLSEYVLFNQ